VDVAPIFVEDITAPNPMPAVVELDSVAEDVTVGKDEIIGGVVVDIVSLVSVIGEEVVSVLPLVEVDVTVVTFEAAVVEATEDVIAEDEDEGAADVVAVVVLVDAAGVLVVVTGGDWFVLVGATTTYEVPNPNKCPQYLLSSISSSKNISFIRKKV
jgi:hypothetical protein